MPFMSAPRSAPHLLVGTFELAELGRRQLADLDIAENALAANLAEALHEHLFGDRGQDFAVVTSPSIGGLLCTLWRLFQYCPDPL